MVRLFVGGLAEDVTAEQLAGRFRAFGAVRGSQVLAPKANDTLRPPTAACRGFGYVDLELADEAALRKLVSVYNGSKWKGHALKVQLARPDFLARLREEREREQEKLADQGTQGAATPAELTITAPDGTEVEVAPNKKRTAFPDAAPAPLTALSWEGLPPTPAQLRKRAFIEEMAPAYAAANAVRQQARKRARQQAIEEPASSEELDAVDFMDGEDIAAKAPVDLSRFSDSEDEQHSRVAKAAHMASTVDAGEADELWAQQGGIEHYLAALEQEQSAAPAEEPGSTSSAAQSEAAASSDSFAAPPETLGQGQGSTSSGLSSPADREIQDTASGGGELGVQQEEQSTASEQEQLSSRGSSQGSEDGREAAQADAGSGEAESAESGGEDAASESDDASDAEGGSQGGNQLTAEPEPDWTAVFAELEAGCQFWTGGAGAQEREAQWRASRRVLAAEWKSARRDALRRAPAAQGARRRLH